MGALPPTPRPSPRFRRFRNPARRPEPRNPPLACGGSAGSGGSGLTAADQPSPPAHHRPQPAGLNRQGEAMTTPAEVTEPQVAELQLYPVEEAADMLRLGRTTVFDLLRNG